MSGEEEGLLNVSDYERVAEELLDPATFGYFAGGAGDEWTLRENLEAFTRAGSCGRACSSTSPR